MRKHLAPLAIAIVSGLALSLVPFAYGRMTTKYWSAPTQYDIEYILQHAAKAYFSGRAYLSDIAVTDGATLYPWLPFIPAVYLARLFGLNVFAIAILWAVFGSVAIASTAYAVCWSILQSRWAAAGIVVALLADGSSYHPFIHQIHGILEIATNRANPHLALSQFRLTNPALDLPFIFFSIFMVALTRRRPERRLIVASGLLFGLSFYIYFYVWTLIAAGLVLAFVLDRQGRRLYAGTLVVGAAIGIPRLVLDFFRRAALAPDAIARFGLFAEPRGLKFVFDPNGYNLILIPCLLLLMLVWIRRSHHNELLYLWSLAVAGLLLSNSFHITNVYLHDYHWSWFAQPLFSLMLCLTVAIVFIETGHYYRPWSWIYAGAITLFFFTGLWVATLEVRKDPVLRYEMQSYAEYRNQRMEPQVKSFEIGAMTGGDDGFCRLAAIGEGVVALGGDQLWLSLALRNTDMYARYALNEYLVGVADREQFATRLKKFLSRRLPPPPDDTFANFMQAFDAVSLDPERFLRTYDVRYVALRVGQPAPPFLNGKWVVIQNGPSWNVYERLPTAELRRTSQGQS